MDENTEVVNRANPPRRTAARKARKGDGKAVKRTLCLSPETDVKLGVLARVRGVDRSKLAESILADALRCVVVSIRQQGEPV